METDKKGFGAVVKREDPYGAYIDRYVEIIAQDTVYWGKYQGINDNDDIILKPSVSREFYPTHKKGENREIIFTLIDEPQFINRNFVKSLSSIREEHILSVIERREIIFPSMKE